MGDLKLQIILVVLVAVAFLAGFFIYRQVSLKGTQKQNEIYENVSLPTPVASPTPAQIPQRIPAVRTQATTSGTALPRTAAPVALFGIFAASAAISGFFLRKFPE